MPKSGTGTNTHLEHLFDVELEYRQGMARVLSDRGQIGDYIGSGEGAAFGPEVNGIVLWDLFEEQGEFICGSNLRGIIKTDDGAQIAFDSIGYFMRPDMAKPTDWVTTASVNFKTDAQRFTWLNTVLALLQGKFDMGSYRHSYRVYAQVAD